MKDLTQPCRVITIDRSTLLLIPPEHRAEYVMYRIGYALRSVDLLDDVAALTVQVK